MKVEKPIQNQTNIAKKFNDLIYDGLPINKFCKEQDLKNKRKKFQYEKHKSRIS